jgi:hypothetical protein
MKKVYEKGSKSGKNSHHNNQSGSFMMTILLQITLDFNRKIKLSNDGGELSSDSGQLV